MRKLIAGITLAAAALTGAGATGYAVHGQAAGRSCTFDGGGTIASGDAARTAEGTVWQCTEDGTLVKLAAAVRPARQLPSWVHWRQAPGFMRDVKDCGGGPAVIVWGGNGDTSAMVCRSGVAETS